MGLELMPAGPGLTVGQVGHQVRHHVAADQLPAEVIVLALAVLTLGQVVVFLKGAARCGQTDVSVPPQTSCSLPKSPAGMDAAASHKEGEWCGHLSLCSHSCQRGSRAAPCSHKRCQGSGEDRSHQLPLPPFPLGFPSSEMSCQVSARGGKNPTLTLTQ